MGEQPGGRLGEPYPHGTDGGAAAVRPAARPAVNPVPKGRPRPGDGPRRGTRVGPGPRRGRRRPAGRTRVFLRGDPQTGRTPAPPRGGGAIPTPTT
ncbi:Exonuclease SbcC [Streptomyces misionensis JCM 4497]